MTLQPHLAARQAVLTQLGGSPAAITQVLRYCENHFERDNVPAAGLFPMADEPHLADWRTYADQQGSDTLQFLQLKIPQLCIPIQAGISKTPAYNDVVRRGRPFQEEPFGGRLTLECPEQLRLVIHAHPAGALPIFVTHHRADFEVLDRALAFHHEPVPINPSVNAHTMAGFLNWDRVHRYQALWTAQHGIAALPEWGKEMQRVAAAEKWRFYDRFMLVCEHPYSGLSAEQLGLDMTPEAWLQASTQLRLEHEFVHYATMRLYGYMGLNLFDETICDWAGIMAALGRFESRWFLHFLGLEAWPQVRPEGRVHNYCQELDSEAFTLQCHLMVRVAAGVEALTRTYYRQAEHLPFLLALTRLTLELLASEARETFFREAYEEAGTLLTSQN